MPRSDKRFSNAPRKSTDGTDYSELQAKETEQDDLSVSRKFISQVREEYNLAKDALLPKIEVWQKRLKLYNNQRKNDTVVGEPLMFTVFQTVLASVTNDQMDISFLGREEGDNEIADNLTATAKYDFDQMEKAQIDYDWNWNTGFFGRALVLMHDFDRKRLCVQPEVIDPMTWLRDPDASSVNGLNGHHAMRFGGNHLYMTREEMERTGAFVNLSALDKKKEDNDQAGKTSTDDEILDQAARMRSEAQGRNIDVGRSVNVGGDNKQYKILRWFTYRNGYKCVAFFTENWDLIRFQYFIDQEGYSKRNWPITDRALYPMARDWDGVSIPDLTEDKQRAMAVLQNLYIQNVHGTVYPMYVYDKSAITNQNDLNFEANKFIGVPGSPANRIVPVTKDRLDVQMIDYALKLFDLSAQKATATPEIQQGRTSQENRTLGELNLVASKVDTRNSLTLKIFGWSEKMFWQLWYAALKDNMDEHIDEKVIRIVGAFGAEWRPLQREALVADADPDIEIVSRYIAEGKRMREMQEFDGFAQVAMQDPTVNRRYVMKRMARLRGMQKDEIDRMFPPTVDELVAAWENRILNENRLADEKTQERAVPKPMENHVVHLEVHAMASDTPAARAHIKSHRELLRLQQTNPELFPELMQQQQQGTDPNAQGAPQGGGQPIQSAQQPASPSQLSVTPGSYQ